MGRNAGGVNGMDLAKGDYLVGMEPVRPDFEIIKKESKSETQNLDEIEKRSHQGSSLTVSNVDRFRKRASASFARRSPSTASLRAAARASST